MKETLVTGIDKFRSGGTDAWEEWEVWEARKASEAWAAWEPWKAWVPEKPCGPFKVALPSQNYMLGDPSPKVHCGVTKVLSRLEDSTLPRSSSSGHRSLRKNMALHSTDQVHIPKRSSSRETI